MTELLTRARSLLTDDELPRPIDGRATYDRLCQALEGVCKRQGWLFGYEKYYFFAYKETDDDSISVNNPDRLTAAVMALEAERSKQ